MQELEHLFEYGRESPPVRCHRASPRPERSSAPDQKERALRIIGIDPGLNRTGYGVVDSLDHRSGGQVPVEGGVSRSKPKDALESRIFAIYSDIREVLDELRPDAMALEQLHSHYAFPKTAIIMGHVRGAVCLAAAERGIPVTDYAPTRVKHVLTGSGRAGKEQIQRAVAAQLGLAQPPSPNDVADAFALAICHALAVGSPLGPVR